MAKRFIDTSFYKSPYVRGLKGTLKGLYAFIICDCDNAGIWAADMEVASLYIGFKVTDEEFQESFVKAGKAINLNNGKYFFPDFIQHQHPKGLSDKNPAHTHIIFELNKHALLDDDLCVKEVGTTEYPQGVPERYLGNGKGKGNGNGNGKGNGKAVEILKKIENPFSEQFLETWEIWKKYKQEQFKFKYKSSTTEQATVNSLVTLSNGVEGVAIEIIKQSISNGWKGFFELKNNDNGKQQNIGIGNPTRALFANININDFNARKC